MRPVSRRESLALVAQATALTLVGAATPAYSAPADAAAEIAKFVGGAALEPGKITLDLPEIAENGNAIPLAIDIESPMTAEDNVTDVLVLADANPWPRVASFHLTPLSGRAAVATRIRLAGTQTVSIVAKTNAGRFLIAQRQVKVTIGGCGG
ncbi:thiosulfate oxidation carrier protein SoxY [Bradyrhizobium sp. WSM2793]|uniref:thiosulfate oxidation carrier protein SoxY n=1 Tax=Bradyrhizobium sp. WSM2793 TaxID=1038866 RepID=UPI0003794352|nr:thiosulfate oxidation carrier protein SoxY [Bradyrhizobium sp. WSM2793]